MNCERTVSLPRAECERTAIGKVSVPRADCEHTAIENVSVQRADCERNMSGQ